MPDLPGLVWDPVAGKYFAKTSAADRIAPPSLPEPVAPPMPPSPTKPASSSGIFSLLSDRQIGLRKGSRYWVNSLTTTLWRARLTPDSVGQHSLESITVGRADIARPVPRSDGSIVVIGAYRDHAVIPPGCHKQSPDLGTPLPVLEAYQQRRSVEGPVIWADAWDDAVSGVKTLAWASHRRIMYHTSSRQGSKTGSFKIAGIEHSRGMIHRSVRNPSVVSACGYSGVAFIDLRPSSGSFKKGRTVLGTEHFGRELNRKAVDVAWMHDSVLLAIAASGAVIVLLPEPMTLNPDRKDKLEKGLAGLAVLGGRSNRLVLASIHGELSIWSVQLDTGDLLWEQDLAGVGRHQMIHHAGPIANEHVIVATDVERNLRVWSSLDGSPLASIPWVKTSHPSHWKLEECLKWTEDGLGVVIGYTGGFVIVKLVY